MFNTMTITKTAGALIGSLLFLMLVKWGADSVYHVGAEAHGDEEVAQAYTIAVADTGAESGEAAESGPDFMTVFASADAAAGEKVFAKCKACHKLDGADGVGPHLNGIVGRAVAGAAGYGYSTAMVDHVSEAPDWTPEALSHFLESPKTAVKGTKMSFSGLPKVEDRANLIAYLETQK